MRNQHHNKVSTIKSMIIFSAIPFAFIAHIAIGFLLGSQNQWPLTEIVIISASLVLLFRSWLKSSSRIGWMFFLNVCAWLLAAVFLWWTQIYSAFPTTKSNLAIGDYLKFAPNNFDNKSFNLDSALSSEKNQKSLTDNECLNKATLFVFVRGWW